MQAEPLDGRIEKIYAWRWVTLPRPSATCGDGGEDADDSVMTVGEGGSPTKTPSKCSTCRFREFFVKWVGKSHWKNSWIDEIRVYIFVCCNCTNVVSLLIIHFSDMILVYPCVCTHTHTHTHTHALYSLMFTSRSHCVRTYVIVTWRLLPLWTSLPTSSEDTRDAVQPPIKTHRWRSWR